MIFQLRKYIWQTFDNIYFLIYKIVGGVGLGLDLDTNCSKTLTQNSQGELGPNRLKHCGL